MNKPVKYPPDPSTCYLGDGVYVEIENEMLKLSTQDGINVTNEVYLEGEVWAALEDYVRRLKQT